MALNEALKNEEKAIHVVHFIGVNKMDGKEHKIALAGGSGWVEEDEFVRLVTGKPVLSGIKVAAAKVPRLVLLQLCGESSLDPSLAGLAKKIINAGVPFVVASQHRIKDKAKDNMADDPAALFARAFYAALMQKQAVDLAVQAGRNEILMSTDPLAFGTPVLYLCCDPKPLIVAKQSSGRTPGTRSGADQETTPMGTSTGPAPITDRRKPPSTILQEPQQALAAAAGAGPTTIVTSRSSTGDWKKIAAIKKAGLDKGQELKRESEAKEAIKTMMKSASDVDSIRMYLEAKLNSDDVELVDVYLAMREALDKGN